MNGTITVPSIGPSIQSLNLAVPSALNVALPASAVRPVGSQSVAVGLAAASKDAPTPDDVPKAATPAPAPASKTANVLRRLGLPTIAGMLERKNAPKNSPAAVSIDDGAKLFDGSETKTAQTEAETPVAAGDSKASRVSGLKARLAASQAKRDAQVDAFGGPLSTPMTFRQRVGFGLKSGLNLLGIGALLKVTLAPLLAVFPWPQYLSDTVLRGFGRVALLTKMGPNEIAAGLAESPLSFMGISLPMAVAWEEITYRLLGFGAIFLVLAAMKPFSRWITSMISELPDAAGVVGAAKKVLKAGDWLSRLAFPIAAALSSFNFAVAHFGTWGVAPFVLILNLVAGVFLAHTAYKSRSLTAPILAHFVFNLVPILTIYLAMTLSPMTAAAFAIIAGILGVASLFHSWLSHRKERAWRVSNGGKTLLVALLMFGGLATTMYNPATHRAGASPETVASAIQKVQEHKTETAPTPAAADTAVVASPLPPSPRRSSRARS
ncbi:MAG: CPBP family intramembrane metalloprotease [Elusimicrobiota bacterium]|nr:MAG: CPBP family intramembrane metalloprotease [Elusimicrobiota bacterium]